MSPLIPPGVTHKLKCWPQPFSAVWDNVKTYEVRKEDRGFSIGDTLDLREYQPYDPFTLVVESYSGRQILARVVYKTPGGSFGIPMGLCVLGIKVLERAEGVFDAEVRAHEMAS